MKKVLLISCLLLITFGTLFMFSCIGADTNNYNSIKKIDAEANQGSGGSRGALNNAKSASLAGLSLSLIDGGLPRSASIAFLPDGRAKISATKSRDLTVFTQMPDGSYEKEILYTPAEWDTLAVDDQGHSHIVYTDSVDSQLKYMTDETGAWVTSVVNPAGAQNFYYYNDPVLDANGNVYFSFYQKAVDTFDLYLGVCSQGQCTSQLIAGLSGKPYQTNTAIDGLGHLHVSIGYYIYATKKFRISHFTDETGQWSRTDLDECYSECTAWSNPIAADQNGNVFFPYYCKEYAGGPAGTWIASRINGTWTTTLVGNVGFSGSELRVDGAGDAHFILESNNDSYYYHYSNGSWSSGSIIENIKVFGLATDSANRPHIVAIHKEDVPDFYHLTLNAGVWDDDIVDEVTAIHQVTSMAVDSQGVVHLAYYDMILGNLIYANNESGTWQKNVIASVNDPSADPNDWPLALRLDGNDNLYLAFYDFKDSMLRMAVYQNGAWQISDIGPYTENAFDLFVESGGVAHICASDYDQLYYLNNQAGGWTGQLLNISPDNIRRLNSCSIALDPIGHVCIGHAQSSLAGYLSYSTVFYLTNETGNWTDRFIGLYFPDWEMTTTMALDNLGNPYVFYDKQTFIMATESNGLWRRKHLEQVRGWAAMLFDDRGIGHIGYQVGRVTDRTSGYIKYAENSFGPWVTYIVDGPKIFENVPPSFQIDSAMVHMAYAPYGGLYYATFNLPAK